MGVKANLIDMGGQNKFYLKSRGGQGKLFFLSWGGVKAIFYKKKNSITFLDFIVFSWVGGGGVTTNLQISSGGKGKFLLFLFFSTLFRFNYFLGGVKVGQTNIIIYFY